MTAASRAPGACCNFSSEFNHVAGGVGHAGEWLGISVLASPDEPPPSPLNLLERPVAADEPERDGTRGSTVHMSSTPIRS